MERGLNSLGGILQKESDSCHSEALFCCTVWMKAAGSEPQPRDKGLFWLREVIVVWMGQNRREVFCVVTGPTKCQNGCLQDVI